MGNRYSVSAVFGELTIHEFEYVTKQLTKIKGDMDARTTFKMETFNQGEAPEPSRSQRPLMGVTYQADGLEPLPRLDEVKEHLEGMQETLAEMKKYVREVMIAPDLMDDVDSSFGTPVEDPVSTKFGDSWEGVKVFVEAPKVSDAFEGGLAGGAPTVDAAVKAKPSMNPPSGGYTYFISFYYDESPEGRRSKGDGFAFTALDLERPIRTFVDVEVLRQSIRQQGYKGVAILNFIRLDGGYE